MPLFKLSNPQCELIDKQDYDAFATVISEAFSGNHEYTGIDLKGLYFNPNNTALIMGCVKLINEIEEIRFTFIDLDDETFAVTLANLEESTHLKKLDFYGCVLSEANYARLFDFLIRHPHITSLGLAGQKIDDVKFNSFKEKIPETKLTELDLRFNLLMDRNLLALGQIAQLSSLTTLSIGQNPMTSKGIKAFAEAIRGTNVTQVELMAFVDYEGHDHSSQADQETIEAVCKTNRASPLMLSNGLQRLSLRASITETAAAAAQTPSSTKLSK